jgi:putative lipoprotein
MGRQSPSTLRPGRKKVRTAFVPLETLLLVAAIALCGCGDRGAGPETKLFGAVHFREAPALPAGARLEVRLEDAGQASGAGPGAAQSTGAAASIATQAVEAAGREPPISFTLAVPRNALLPRHRYVLRAEIRSATGELLFVGPPDQRPLGNPNTTGRVDLTLTPPN